MLDGQAEPELHTWCVFESDLEGGWDALPVRPDHLWDGYDVRFPAVSRRLTTAYGCLTSAGLRRSLVAALGEDLLIGRARDVESGAVTCEDDRRLTAKVVIDGRGARSSAALDLGWQKFVGLEVRTTEPHGVERPVVMDATVPQLDGFRFIYVLPLGPDTLLIEDTRYSDGPEVDHAAYEAEIMTYARDRGWSVAEVVRREDGVLPVVLDGDIDRFWTEADADAGVPRVGMAGAFFHPTTGYSLPDAVRTARIVRDALGRGPAELARVLRASSIEGWRERAYFRLLNRMLYRAAEPAERYRVLERFYRLPQGLVERFYAARTTPFDKVRILAGKPPVPIGRAIRVIWGG